MSGLLRHIAKHM